MKINISFQLNGREARELRRAARQRKQAVAPVARALTLEWFGVTMTKRQLSGPGMRKTG